VSSQVRSRSQSPDWVRNNKPNPVWGIRHLMLDLTPVRIKKTGGVNNIVSNKTVL